MKTKDIDKYYEIFDRLGELFPIVESAFEDGDTCVEFEDFMSEVNEPHKYKLCKNRERVMFLDTIKYFQQSLGTLASNLTDSEKFAIRRECKKFIRKDENLSKKFNLLPKKDQEWVLAYWSTRKVMIPYKTITEYDSLDTSSEDGIFFLPHNFCSSLKDNVITTKSAKK